MNLLRFKNYEGIVSILVLIFGFYIKNYICIKAGFVGLIEWFALDVIYRFND